MDAYSGDIPLYDLYISLRVLLYIVFDLLYMYMYVLFLF